MAQVYANNAGTSWPKAPGVNEAVQAALWGGPQQAASTLQDAGDALCGFVGTRHLEGWLLTPGCTSALGLALTELSLVEGDVVLTSALEHHALLRPLQHLVRTRGVVHRVVPYRPGQPLDLEFARAELRAGHVRLVACTAASNVTGELLPIEELLALAHAHGALLLLDAAQIAGLLPLSLDALPVDLLTIAGHKGPLGPLGIGALWTAPHVTLGGEGAACDLSDGAAPGTRCTPARPGYCDIGSVNAPAAAGLSAALRHHQADAGRGGAHACALRERLQAELLARPGCRVLGGAHTARTATLSVQIDGLPLSRAEAFFARRGITVRAGQHCAPMALQAIGCPQGTLRISFGPFNHTDDVARIVEAIDEVA